MARVLIVATGRKTKGGITSVIQAHATGVQWKEYHCTWIQTHGDGNIFIKLWYYFSGFLKYIILLPFCDIVHFHFSESTSVLRKSIMLPLAKLLNKHTISHFHAFSLDTTIRSKYRLIYCYVFSHSDVVIVLSQFWKKALVDELNLEEDKVVILFNPCPVVLPKRELSNAKIKDCHYILYAGAVEHRKGYDDLIKAFAIIAKKHPNWRIVFAGSGEVENGINMAKELGIEDQIVFLGWVTGAEKAEAFNNASVFCLPSYAEGFPMSVLEAWAYGLPVVTTPVGGIPDIAINGRNLLLFEPGDVPSLSRQLDLVMDNKTLRDNLSKESTRLSLTIFNIKTINKQLGEIYRTILTK